MREISKQAIRIQNIARVGKLSLATVETGNVQKAQISLNQFETYDNLNSIQLYGFASAMPTGTDVVSLHLAGDPCNGFVVASNHNEFRPTGLETGAIKIYDNMGQYVYISNTGGTLSINIVAGENVNVSCSTKVTITAPTVEIIGNLQVTGSITAGYGGSDSVGLQTHQHPDPQGGYDAPPVAGT